MIGTHPIPTPGPNASPTPCDRVSQRHSLGEVKLRSGLSVRQIADRTGLHYRRVARITSGKGRARRREVAALRHYLEDEIRLHDMLIPFFVGRVAGRAPAADRREIRVPATAEGQANGR